MLINNVWSYELEVDEKAFKGVCLSFDDCCECINNNTPVFPDNVDHFKLVMQYDYKKAPQGEVER